VEGGENVNDENLVPFQYQSGNEAREKGKKGGIASGKTRREKKTIREAFALLKDLPLDNEKLREQLKKAGVTKEVMTYGAAMAYMTVINGMKGNPSFMRLAFEMLGENDVQGVSKIPGTMNVHFSDKPEDFK
jgi:hypothetical protein